MLRTLTKSRLHRATVTDANLHDMGSVALNPDQPAEAPATSWPLDVPA